jgi:RHS repeat-associated protein
MLTATVSGTSASYGYDGDGYRVRSTVAGVTRYFLHDGSGRILAEYDGAGNLLIEHIYLGDRRVASRQADGTRSYVQHDLLGSSWIVTQGPSASEYAIWDYWPFGEPVSQFDLREGESPEAPEALCTAANPVFCDGFESGNLLAWTCTNGQSGCVEPDWELFEPLFTGKKQDTETDLFYFEARYMDAKLGRFTSPDEGPYVLENPQTFNRYAYAINSPLTFSDPDGRAVLVANRPVQDWPLFGHAFIIVMPTGDNRVRFQHLMNDDGQIVLGATRGWNSEEGFLSLHAVDPRENDRDSMKSATQIFQVFGDQQSIVQFEKNVIEAFLSYRNDSLKYKAADSGSRKNSNSFASGVLDAAGVSSDSKPSRWQLSRGNPGWSEPIKLPDATLNDGGGGGW